MLVAMIDMVTVSQTNNTVVPLQVALVTVSLQLVLVTVSLQVVLVTVSLALVTVSLQMVLVLVSLQGKSLYPQIQLCLLCLYRNTSSKPRKTICDAIITPRIGGHVLVVRIGSIV